MSVATDPIVFWQMSPCWGLPSASPFCMKIETWLRMAGIPYLAKSLSGPPKSASRKAPYIERPDGSLLSDSSLIISTLTQERHVRLDEGISPADQALGMLIQRLFEEELYFVLLHDRWVDDAGWKLTAPAYFGTMPWVVRTLVVPIIRRQVIRAAQGQGVARLPASYRDTKGVTDVNAVSEVLGDKEFFLGRPSTVDAVAYAFLANLLGAPIRSPTSDSVRRHDNLVSFCARMKDTYWKDWAPPSA